VIHVSQIQEPVNIVLDNLTAPLAILMTGLVILVPLLGLTLRFALKPLIESVARLRSADAGLGGLAEQIAAMREELTETQGAIEDLKEKIDFDHRLGSGKRSRIEGPS
jgi:hypothetical protein